MKREEAIRKVTALLRLAGRPGTIEEGATALAKAQELMDRYEIEQAGLTLDGQPAAEPEEDPVDFSDRPEGQLYEAGHMRRMEMWRYYLAHAIAKANGCFLFTSYRGRRAGAPASGGKSIEIVGRPSAVEAVRYMNAWLAGEIVRLRNEQGAGMGKVWRREFCEGAASELRVRLERQHQSTIDDMRAQAAAGSALVKLNTAIVKVEGRYAAVEKWARAKHRLRSTGGSRSVGRDYSAREAGERAARGIDLGGNRRGLGSGPRKQIGGGQ